MSRSTTHQQRQQQKLDLQQQQHQQQLLAQQQQKIAENEATAAASDLFDYFCQASTMRNVLGLHRNMCELIGLRPAPLNEFYPKLKARISSWKAQALWKKFDARAAHRVYGKGNACTGTRVLVIGGGPCGLRTAIEAQLLGAKVVVVEKRDRISRNNVLHLWPFVITDLRNLGAKKFYGKFCAGSIDHISIRQLQCILLKVALLLGVEVHEGVSFEGTIEPSGDGCGWRAAVSPSDHAVSHYEFDVLIGADGKRNTLEGFKRKEFRGKLAIAITANFINKKSEAEAKAEEISGVAFIFNQSFFKELYHTTGIDLENIVYYKDETHYFVMTAKKHSLIDKGVIMQDFADPAELLAPANVNTEKLLDYAREAAEFSTKYQMPDLEFAVNHYGKPDVAMFDFTSMFAAETSCRVIVRKGFRLLQCLVGDSLLEPFWPTGSGCARGFLSSMDAAYAIKLWSNPHNSTLGVLAQRESIYRLLNQTTPENLQRDIGSYTVDPATRYPNLNRTSVNVWQVKHLIDTDDKGILEQTFMDTNALQGAQTDTPVRRKRRSGDTLPLSTVLLRWICAQLHAYEFTKDLKEVSDVFTHGKVLCALINRYRPDLVDFNAIKDLSPIECNELAFKILDKEMGIPRVMSGKESVQLTGTESKVWLNYLEQICELFRGEIPHVKHPKMDFSELREKYRINYKHAQPDFSKLLQLSSKQNKSKPTGSATATGTATQEQQDSVDVPQIVHRRSVLEEEKLKRQRAAAHNASNNNNNNAATQAAQNDTPRRAKKRRSADKAANIEERQKRLQEIEQNRQDRLSKRRQQRYQQTQNFYKSLHMLQANTLLREADESSSPFEDYSIFLYRQQAPEFNDRVKELERKLLFPDRERGDIPSAVPRTQADEQFSDRIKSMEQRISTRHGNYGTDKKPKDLMRAIGKIDSSDWNVREIEKKIEQSKKTETHGPKGREKVPKWSKEQFLARQTKMAKPQRQDSREEEKFREIDQTLKNLDKQLKEGHMLEIGERGRNKVASIAGQFVKKDDTSDEKNPPTTVVPKSSTKVALAFKKQAASEKCHFCKQTVYLMEKVNTEGLVFHRSCLKCHHCHTNLRMGNYAFDRDDPNGRFYCTQHYRLPAKAIRPVVRKSGQKKSSQQQQQQQATATNQIPAAGTALGAATGTESTVDGAAHKTPDKLRVHADNVAQLEMLDRGQTPERIEFENTDAMSDGGEPSEEHIIDEHEWSGRNFLPESNNDSESDLSSSDESDTDSDSDLYEVANESPLGAQTLQLANDWIGKQHYSDSDDSDDFYDSSDGIADDGKDDTDGEEFKKARELRREEVRLLPLPANLPTDTETELKLSTENVEPNNEKDNPENPPIIESNENKENIEVISNSNMNRELNAQPDKAEKLSIKSSNSEKCFKSATASPAETPTTALAAPIYPPTTRTEMEKIEQKSDRKFSSEIDTISEKLYRLNNMMKMNKDIEAIAKENLVTGDILKKLTLKEKWLAENSGAAANAAKVTPASQFDEKFQKLVGHKASVGANTAATVEPQSSEKLSKPHIDIDLNELMPRHPDFGSSKTKENVLDKPIKPDRKPVSRDNSTASQDSPKAAPKSQALSRNNSLKKSNKMNLQAAAIGTESKMQIENILDIVKKMDISNNADQDEAPKSPAASNKNQKDIGRLLYDVENKFSPKPNKRLNAKMKEIETQNFAGTMDSIKAQMVMPKETVSAQAATGVDLAKYFPNQKQEKLSANAVNKNQKNLKDVDLAKYFPSSPVPQRRSNVVTVAEKLKKSQTEKSLAPAANTAASGSAPSTTAKLKKQSSLGAATGPSSTTTKTSALSLHDHQLDGAVDFLPKKSAVKISTVKATSTTPKKVKVVKKVPAKSKKTTTTTKSVKTKVATSIIPHDESDQILAEILQQTDDGTTRSPSLEYQKLFQEEKSPSDDVSDKIDSILEETGIDLGIPRKPRSDNPKKLVKAKSLNEAEYEPKADDNFEQIKEDGDRPSGVKNILKRFESMSSANSDEHIFKLRRMESTTGQLNKSRESIVSQETLGSANDLEKTMDYLRNEWRNEATNFLQTKRDNFYAQKQRTEDEAHAKAEEESKKAKMFELPVQYRDSKLAKFFGLKAKSPEKRKSPSKKQKDKSPKKAHHEEKQPAIAQPKNSLEELANISNAKQAKKQAAKEAKNSAVLDGAKIELQTETAASTPISPIEPASNADAGKIVDKPQRPLVEDIRNLPKTGCDKSLNSSRRGSQTSLHSRRASNSSLQENLEQAVSERFQSKDMQNGIGGETDNESIDPTQQISNDISTNSLHEDFVKAVIEELVACSANNSKLQTLIEATELNGKPENHTERRDSFGFIPTKDELSRMQSNADIEESKTNELLLSKDNVANAKNMELDARNPSIKSKSISEPRSLETNATELNLRGSSENESIENLFSQLSDEMLVNVEFDSNDELIDVAPRSISLNAETPEIFADKRDESMKSAEGYTEQPMLEESEKVITPPGNKDIMADETSRHSSACGSPQLSNEDQMPRTGNDEVVDSMENSSAYGSPQLSKEDHVPKAGTDKVVEVMENHKEQLTAQETRVVSLNSEKSNINANDVADAVSQRSLENGDQKLANDDKVSNNKTLSQIVEELIMNSIDTVDSPSENMTQGKLMEREHDDQFPTKPQRRHKSKSSSSESPAPIAPQRLKKKLATLNPSDMPPSVQDLLHEVYVKQISLEEPQTKSTTKFPTTVEDAVDEAHVVTQNAKPQVNRECDNKEAKHHEKSNPDSNEGLPIQAFLSLSSSVQPTNIAINAPKIITPPKRQSKENSLDWDMEKMPASPMPRRKFVLNERAPSTLSEVRLRDVSPTSSIKILNNLPDESADSERRLIQAFEMERRQALVKRDKDYEGMPKPPLERTNSTQSSSNHSGTNTTNSSGSSKLSLSHSQRAGTQDSVLTNREVTPPNFKKLTLPSNENTAQSSRRSSFAFIDLENSVPIIAPMPKKLNVPKYEPKFVPEPGSVDANAEVFKNRPWPRAIEESAIEHDADTSDEDNDNIKPKMPSRTPSPIAEVFKNRQWPDGNTDFSKHKVSEPLLSGTADDIEVILAKRRAARRNKETLSQSPPPTQSVASSHSALSTRKAQNNYSKSINDLRKNSPLHSTYDSSLSLHKLATPSTTRSSYSSMDTDYKSNAGEQWPTKRTHMRLATNTDDVDASTRMLLDRSKRLHNRKRDFVNERVVERNPYMRDVVASERLGNEIDDEISTYRPSYLSATTSSAAGTTAMKFPTSRALGRSTGLSNTSYDYMSAAKPSLSTYGSTYSSNRYTPATSSHIHYPSDYTRIPIGSHSSGTTSSLYRSSPNRSSGGHLIDYFKRGHNERDSSKESCVQSESETTSPDEVEHNSATEISTDSEFDNDEVKHATPRIFIDDTHLRKPTRVQIKSSVITPRKSDKYSTTVTTSTNAQKKGSYMLKYQPQQQPHQPQQAPQQFKPLVQVDPTLLITKRSPLQNPRQGDYLLNKTASTEGIASKKSLELKKRYLLGEPANGNKIQKSGSTSVLDSRIRTFQSNISECQKLLNPSNDISPSMKTFLDRTKLGESVTKQNELMRSATSNLLNDLKVEITIQKASSTASTDNEKENVFVNNKNELNKGKEYSETINSVIMEKFAKKSPTTPTNNQTIIETINLVTPEKQAPIKDAISAKLLHTDSNIIIDLTGESPVKGELTVVDDGKPDVSKDVRESIPDILGHIELDVIADKQIVIKSNNALLEESTQLLGNEAENSGDEEKCDSPEKQRIDDQYEAENETLQIEVPTIPWNTRKMGNLSTTTNSSSNTSCTSSSSSIEDIQHYILDSTTSPDTQPGVAGSAANKHNVPRLEVHDTSGTLMQIDSLMIIDGKYVGDPEDLKYMEIPAGVIVPEMPAIKTSEVDEEAEVDLEPVTATPEPAECTVIEAEEAAITSVGQEPQDTPPLPDHGPPLPEKGPPRIKPANLKFDTKNANKIETLKNLPLIVDETVETTKAIKPLTLDLRPVHKTPDTPTTPTPAALCTPCTPMNDNDKTPTAELLSKGSDSETELTGTAHVSTETELSDWTADDCISENFVESEYMANALGKGTVKRNKRDKSSKSTAAKILPSTNEVMHEVAKSAPVAEFEGILKAIDLDDIEFMDTGSEGSCAEAYSATNTAMLRNRGYVEFIDNTTPKQTPTHKGNSTETITVKYKPVLTKRDERLGVDYIEQGAYIMEDAAGDPMKTPVNEQPEELRTNMTQSLTDSSTLNDLDEDSLLNTNTNSATKTVTTEESEALTIVTSPLESSSAQIRGAHTMPPARAIERKGSATAEGSTPSSSEQQPKTSQSTCTTTGSSSNNTGATTTGNTTSKSASPGQSAAPQRQASEEFSYEEYVRVLQQKIAQISTARDSIDSRKQKRKSSKGEAPTLVTTNNTTTVIEPNAMSTPVGNAATVVPVTNSGSDMSTKGVESDVMAAAESSAMIANTNKVPEIPTLTRKLEEITKERTKQKDLIHDLVMDKLQSKKQLNAEKRLHRSRQRTMMTSGYNSGSSLSPTPKIAPAATPSDSNCTSRAHYHASTAAPPNAPPAIPKTVAPLAPLNLSGPTNDKSTETGNYKENSPLQKSATYVSAYGMSAISPTRFSGYKQRPFSEHIDTEQLDAFTRYKLNKTPSFSYALATNPIPTTNHSTEHTNSKQHEFVTPVPMARKNHNRTAAAAAATHNSEESISASAENLRSEARARARLKSNSELGLSPEEKMQLMRKRLQYDQGKSTTEVNKPLQMHNERAMNERERKMSSSKSVNDLVYISSQQQLLQQQQQQQSMPACTTARMEKSNAKSTPTLTDFALETNTVQSGVSTASTTPTQKKSKRQKDPERRKSLIQSLSSFFHKSSSSSSPTANENAGSSHTGHADKRDLYAANGSAQTERPGTSGSTTTSASGSVDGMFSRFRISPKSKEKSKEKDIGIATNLATANIGTKTTNTHSKEAAASSECMLTGRPYMSTSSIHTLATKTNNICQKQQSTQQQQQHQQQQLYYKNQRQQNSNNKKSSSPVSPTTTATATGTATFSSSSPQLYTHHVKSNHLNSGTSSSTVNSNKSNPSKCNNAGSSNANAIDEPIPPPIPPLPLNYQRSDDESYTNETREQKRQRALSKAMRQAELKRLRIAQEIEREQEEIEVQLKELEARGVLIEKALRGEAQNLDNLETGSSDEKLLKELLEIWRNITQLKKRDEELGIRQQELQLEHRHAQLKEELNLRLSCNKLDKSSADVAAEGAILNEMLEIVAKRAALRPTASNVDLVTAADLGMPTTTAKLPATLTQTTASTSAGVANERIVLDARGQMLDNDESHI